MTLIVEDGTGMANAESYVGLVDGETYWAAHGSPAAWTALTDPQKESALRYATRWIENAPYIWHGVIKTYTQSLRWPRLDVYDADGRDVAELPSILKDAVCELALEHVANPINTPDETAISTVSAGSVSVTYAQGAEKTHTHAYVDGLLRPLYSYSANAVRTVR